MGSSEYRVGKFVSSWKEGSAQTITFVVTEDCNLRCKYCYITHKVSNKKMKLEDAKAFIDYMLTADIERSDAVIIEFIGGEPFIEMELIDQISDYYKRRSFEVGNDWFWNYRFSICTNGVNYSDEAVQAYILKNYGKLSVTITVDGTKEKHDLQRVFPDGTGSYDQISKSIELWQSQFSGSTKATFASDDLPLLKDSILDLWSRGITDVAANVVFEDVWKEGDDKVFEDQLVALADHILENNLFDKFICTLFDETLGGYVNEEQLKQTSCGAGKMIALGTDGKIFPCIRYQSYSLNNQEEWSIGSLETGIDMERVRPFMTAMNMYQSDSECLNCEIANGCKFCQGFNYDESDSSTNFHRVKYICDMHKARVRANEYYFAKLYNRFGIKREQDGYERKRLYFLLSDDYVDYCSCSNGSNQRNVMDDEAILEGLRYSRQNFCDTIFVHSRNAFSFVDKPEYEDYLILHIVPAKFHQEAKKLRKYMLVFDKDSIDLPIDGVENCFLNVESSDIANLYTYLSKLLVKARRININILNISVAFDEAAYKEQLTKIKNILVANSQDHGIQNEVNLISDLCYLHEHRGCKAGDRSLVYAPDKQIYACSAMYATGKDRRLGDTVHGLDSLKAPQLYRLSHSPLCATCDAYQCTRCIKINQDATKEINVPPSYQCRKSFIEREVSRLFQQEIDGGVGNHTIKAVPFDDPMTAFYADNNISIGYYKLGAKK